MTEDTYYNKVKPFMVVIYALSISVTSGFGIQYLLISTGETVLYSQFMSLALGSTLGMMYLLTKARNIRLQKEEENRKELWEEVKQNNG
jgi:hypothetical protein